MFAVKAVITVTSKERSALIIQIVVARNSLFNIPLGKQQDLRLQYVAWTPPAKRTPHFNTVHEVTCQHIRNVLFSYSLERGIKLNTWCTRQDLEEQRKTFSQEPGRAAGPRGPWCTGLWRPSLVINWYVMYRKWEIILFICELKI